MTGLPKQNLPLPFAQGTDSKTDRKQVKPGKLLSLENAVFTKLGRLTKRNGFGDLTALSTTPSTLTTYNGNLVAIAGNQLSTLLQADAKWYTQGYIKGCAVSALSLSRTNVSVANMDVAVAAAYNLACTTWTDTAGNSWYQVQDNTTGQIAVGPVQLPATSVRSRAFVLGQYFIVTFAATVSASPHLQYIAIPILTPATPGAATDISTAFSSITSPYDGCVIGANLYVAWAGNDGGGAVRAAYITTGLILSSTTAITGYTPILITVAGDTTGNSPKVWLGWTATNLYASCRDQFLAQVLAPTNLGAVSGEQQLTNVAASSTCRFAIQLSNTYSWDSLRSDIVQTCTVTQAGSTTALTTISRGVGLASKAFQTDSQYALMAYGSSNAGQLQPTYFLTNITTGNVIAKLAYQNGGGYYTNFVLPQASVTSGVASFGYLYKSFLGTVNPAVLTPPSTTANIYATTGINLASVDLNANPQANVEIGGGLHLAGGFLWHYDGVKPYEHGFHLYPEDLKVTTSGASGLITAQTYYYVACYEWTDNTGRIHRSAPSVPTVIVTTGATSTNTIKVPTYRLTYKSGVRIVLYRWSTAQQTYYQVTSLSSPTLNSTSTDSVTITDTLADSAITGNTLLYTLGNIVENIACPATNLLTLYRNRLVAVSAEDPNTLWYSKQVIEDVPVEMSDLFTLYVAPTIGAKGSTGPVTALGAMDDKLIPFKKDAIYYISGNGPDNTGANNDFGDATFVVSTIGCDLPNSIAFMPDGLMFQARGEIWLLSRGLDTQYIGAAVEDDSSSDCLTALTIPNTNQVRFTMTDGTTLMYDFLFQQWGTFTGIPGIASTIYQGLHTYVDSYGNIRQETPDSYLDGERPVLLAFTTPWYNLAGMQGLQRAYFFYFLGEYKSPHTIDVQIAYDYNESPEQATTLTPDNYTEFYGDASYYGGGEYGNAGAEEYRVFLKKQKCTAFQLQVREVFDSSFGTVPGEGFNLSGINLVAGVKKGYKPMAAKRSFG